MKVCVITGSPKGENSITYQTVLFLAQRFENCDFVPLHVGPQIRGMERDFSKARAALEQAELLLFCYPVYTFLAPSQLHRFISRLKQEGLDLRGKPAAQITTSKHFYDTTAHAYIEDNCADLGLRYLGGLSADMDDLLSKKGREQAQAFWKLVLWRAEQNICLPPRAFSPRPAAPYVRVYSETEKKNAGPVAIVANLKEGDTGLAAMIEDFRAVCPRPTKLVNLQQFPFSGGCLGCFRCASTGKCIHKDGFDSFLREQIQTCTAIVYAFTIEDHSMGPQMKVYDDRQFCNGHRTVTMGMPMGYLIRGDLDAEPNLNLTMQGRAEVGGNFLAGVATDAEGVARLANTLEYALEQKLTLPSGFLGVGGMKIFRDLIWLMRGMMRADHQFYKAHGQYDFPQKQWPKALSMYLVGALLSNPKVLAKAGNKMNEGMLAPYKKALTQAKKEQEF